MEGAHGGLGYEPTAYENLSPDLAAIIGEKLATLHELQTVYSLADALLMLEVVLVRADNEWKASKAAEKD